MKNAREIRRRLDEIKNLPVEKAIGELADMQYEIGMDACRERGEQREDLLKLHEEVVNLRKLLVGNGDPVGSVMNRLSKLETVLSEDFGNMKEQVDKIFVWLIGDLTPGKETEGGLMKRIRCIEETDKTLKRVVWIAVAAVVGEVVLRLLGIL